MADETRNVHISFLARIREQLEPFSAVRWPDTEFDTSAVTEWYEPFLLGETPTPTRQSRRHETWTAQVTCFARLVDGLDDSVHKAWEMADRVIGALGQHSLEVRDYRDSELALVGHLRFGEASVNPVARTEPRGNTILQQLAVTVEGVLIT